VDEASAWFRQGVADRLAAERFAGDNDTETRCHAIAKWQQTVEKCVKAIVAALRMAGVLHIEIGYGHKAARFIDVLIRLPHAVKHRAVQQELRRLLDGRTRAGIVALDALAPRRPPPGQLPTRNTEYPFQDAAANWTYPASAGVFSQEETQRFRALAHRIVEGVGRITSAIRRRPRD